MRLDVSVMRHMSRDDFRTLTAVEMGMKNHHAVPVPLIVSIAGLRHAKKCLSTLLRFKLVYHDHTHYDGYRLTWAGYDILALHALPISKLGYKIGEGKESDVYEGVREDRRVAIKFHRLGKTSFKAVKAKRDYLEGRARGNWLNMSRLAARKEWTYLSAVSEVLNTPTPLDHNRHAVVMSLASGLPMYQVSAFEDAVEVFETCLGMAKELAKRGLIHCDFNEFNLIVDGNEVTLIDFPQCVSVNHPNADEYYARDVRSLYKFFRMKIKLEDLEDDDLALVPRDLSLPQLDLLTKASGYNHEREPSSDADDEHEDDDDAERSPQPPSCDNESAVDPDVPPIAPFSSLGGYSAASSSEA